MQAPNRQPIPLDEELARQQIEQEVRGEYEDQMNREVIEERHLALTALRFWKVVGMLTIALVGIPLFGLTLGFGVYLFRWASGL